MLNNIDLRQALEDTQLAAAKQMPLPRRVLSKGTILLLILLRVYVLLALPVVGYAFVHAIKIGR
jgi:hypothetical protein